MDALGLNAIEAEAAENTLIDGELLEVDTSGNKLVFGREDNDDGHSVQQSFAITVETIITLDGKPARSWLTSNAARRSR